MPKPSETSTKKGSVQSAAAQPRQLKKPSYQSFKLHKRIAGAKTAGAFWLFGQALATLGRNWKLFGGIIIIYGILNITLVTGFSTFGSLSEVKQVFDQLFTGQWSQLATSAGLFVYLLGASGNNSSATAGVYQVILAVLFSLVIIWVLRQRAAGEKVRLRDGFYKGMAPLVPFMLVLMVVGLQLLPFTVGGQLYTTVMANGIAATGAEQLLWTMVLALGAGLSLYWVSSSLFALYVVTLSDMTPVRALRSAGQLVRYRRWGVLRRLLFLPFILIILAGLVIIPLILFATPVAPWAFFALSLLLLPVSHSYLYALYRSLMERL